MPLDRFNSGDMDAVGELLASKGWQLVRDRLEAEIERKRNWLEQDIEPQPTQITRGYIRALRVALSVPEILYQQIKESLKEK